MVFECWSQGFLWLSPAWGAGFPGVGGRSFGKGSWNGRWPQVGISGRNSRPDPGCTVMVLAGKTAQRKPRQTTLLPSVNPDAFSFSSCLHVLSLLPPYYLNVLHRHWPAGIRGEASLPKCSGSWGSWGVTFPLLPRSLTCASS